MKTFAVAWIISLFVLCIRWVSYAQPEKLRFEQLTIEDGLSNNLVWSMLQDKRGYVWFATPNGLNKFDGYTLTTYKREPRDSTSIISSQIGSLFEDSEGILWIGFDGNGICKFDEYTEKFTCYPHPTPVYAGALSLQEDQEGSLWIGSVDGLYRFDKRTGTFSSENFAPLLLPKTESSLAPNLIHAICKDKTGNLWIGSHHGLHRLHLNSTDKGQPTQVSFTHFRYDPTNPSSLSSNVVYDILEDHKGILWISTDNKLHSFNLATGDFSSYDNLKLSDSKAGDLAEDPQGNLWVATDDGLVCLDKKRTKMVEFKHISIDPHSIANDHIVSLLADRSGTIWVGTLSNGINKANIYQKPFQLYQHHPSYTQSLSLNQVITITEDKAGVVWIGTFGGGLNRFDKHTQTFTHYRHDQENPLSLGDDDVYDVLEDRQGNLWVAHFQGNKPLSKFNPHTGTFENYSAGAYQRLGGDGIFTIYEDKEEVLWLGTTNGVKSFDRKTNNIMHYTHDPNNPNGLSDHWVTTIMEDHQGNLWMGADVGLNKLERKTGRFIQYKQDDSNAKSITANNIRCIFQDSQRNLWIGTRGGGLCRFDYTTETFEAFTTKQGLADNAVYSILEDDAGNLWLGTDKGLSCFSLSQKTFTNYDIADGLQSNQFAISFGIGAHTKGRDGTLYFGGINGFNSFDPAEIQPNPYVPPVVITQLKLFNEPIQGNHETQTVDFSHRENFLSFEFAALNFMNSQKNQYAYRLHGFDRDWIYSGTRRYANYTNLEPGRYIFQIKGTNNDGIWNERGTFMAIVIHPPWWRTWWASAVYGMMVLYLLYSLRQYTVKRERLKNELKLQRIEAEKMLEIDHMKSRFFANISHEFRTPLTLILGPLEKLMAQSAYAQEHALFSIMQRNAQRLLHLINQLLDLSKLEAGSMKLEAKPADIIAFLKTLLLSFTSLAESRQIQYLVQYPIEHPIMYFDADKLEKIIINLVSNAFKFTPNGGKITVTIHIQPIQKKTVLMRLSKVGLSSNMKILELEVQDNGTGIAEEMREKIFDRFYQVDTSRTRTQEGAGIGLSLVKELVELHEGEIALKSKPKQGACFTVRLPLLLADFEQITVREQLRVSDQQNSVATNRSEEKDTLPERMPVDIITPVVLIIEDNADIRQFIRQQLYPAYQVLEACHGAEGYSIAVETIPDLILSDVMMPGMDGVELCRKIKSNDKTAHVPIILLTAKASIEDKLEGLKTGADDYIIKPFEASELLVRIKNLIESRKKLREHFSRQITLEPKAIAITSLDEQFLQRVMQTIEDHMADAAFSLETFCQEVGMSRMQLFRKLKALTDHSPGDFIRIMRLKRAAELLSHGAGTIAEVAFLVGFHDPSYFTKCFQKQFGKTPSEFLATRLV